MPLPNEDTFLGYGCPYGDYAPVEDPTTDLSAANFNNVASMVASLSHISPRAYVVVVGNATTPTVAEHNAGWGTGASVIPTLVRNGVGDITITWPTSVTAEDGTSIGLNLKRCVGWNTEGATPYTVTMTPVTANTMRLRVFVPSTGAANDFVGVNCTVYVR